jgi:hypothetical protein
VHTLVRKAEQLGGVPAAQTKIGQRPDRFHSLLLRPRARPLGRTPCPDHVLGDRSKRPWKPITEPQVGGAHVEPQRERFADAALGLTKAAAVRLAARHTFDAEFQTSSSASCS